MPYRLIHAVPDLWSVSGVAEFMALDIETLRPLVQDVGRQLRAYREGALGVAPDDGAPVEVWFGRPGWVLAQAVERYGAELVVVGGKHHGVLARTLGGSTAHYLVRTLDVPVVVAGVATGRGPLGRVLAAVDLSPAAKRTLDAAERVATALHAELRVLHAVEPFRFPIVAGLAVDEDQFARALGLGWSRPTRSRGPREPRSGTCWPAGALGAGSGPRRVDRRAAVASGAAVRAERPVTPRATGSPAPGK